MEWIEYLPSCIGQRPRSGVIVLVYSPSDGVGLAYLSDEFSVRKRWTWAYKRINNSASIADVTHWMPLPGPPQED